MDYALFIEDPAIDSSAAWPRATKLRDRAYKIAAAWSLFGFSGALMTTWSVVQGLTITPGYMLTPILAQGPIAALMVGAFYAERRWGYGAERMKGFVMLRRAQMLLWGIIFFCLSVAVLTRLDW